MDKTKLDNQMKRFENYLMVDRGLGKVTADGYCRTVSISLRRMKKFCPHYPDVKEHIGWMLEKNYSYSHYADLDVMRILNAGLIRLSPQILRITS